MNWFSLSIAVLLCQPTYCRAESPLSLIEGDWIDLWSMDTECEVYPMRIAVNDLGSELEFYFPTQEKQFPELEVTRINGTVLSVTENTISVRAHDLEAVYHYTVSHERLSVSVGSPDGLVPPTDAGTYRPCSKTDPNS